MNGVCEIGLRNSYWSPSVILKNSFMNPVVAVLPCKELAI